MCIRHYNYLYHALLLCQYHIKHWHYQNVSHILLLQVSYYMLSPVWRRKLSSSLSICVSHIIITISIILHIIIIITVTHYHHQYHIMHYHNQYACHTVLLRQYPNMHCYYSQYHIRIFIIVNALRLPLHYYCQYLIAHY